MENFRENVKKLLEGSIDSFNQDKGVIWFEAKKILEEEGFEIFDEDDLETNGWQIDYWTKVKYNENYYEIEGSMYCGNFEISKE